MFGVLIVEQLNWKPHIANVQSKLSITTAILYKCSQVIDAIVLRYAEIHTTVTSLESSLSTKQLYGYYLVQVDMIILLLFSREQMH